MLTIFYKTGNRISMLKAIEMLNSIPKNDILWIDLNNPTDSVRNQVEKYMQINLQTHQQIEEIESSSRYLETEDLIIANSNFLLQQNGSYSNQPVSFLLKDKVLVSYRNADLKSISELSKKIETLYKSYQTGYHILVALFETRIDSDADLIENIAKEISTISKNLNLEDELDEDTILEIKNLQESTMMIRENIIDKQRVVSGILKSEQFPEDLYPKLRIMIKDIGSLIDHTAFSFERLEYLQNTFLGLVNIEQNKIIKIFTVASVIFMPPTLIASIYGMNFKVFPELSWKFGYGFALFLMLASVTGIIYFFRRRKWL